MYNRIIYKYICYILITLTLIVNPCANINAKEISDSEIKASWIYTTIQWIEWKSRPKSSYTICTIGRDKVYIYLKKIRNNNKRFSVINKDPMDSFAQCHMLYISESEQEYYSEILEKVSHYDGVVTVSSIDGFARRGGVIEFVIKKKARLIINLKTAKNIKVAIDNELYGWAETIY